MEEAFNLDGVETNNVQGAQPSELELLDKLLFVDNQPGEDLEIPTSFNDKA